MVEPELAFADLDMAMDNVEGLLRFVIGEILDRCDEDLLFLERFYEKGLMEKLRTVVDSNNFMRISYTDAIRYLKEEIQKNTLKWEFPNVEFGTNLKTQHERWLTEKKFGKKCVFVYDYPRENKAFYMRDNVCDMSGDAKQRTVRAMDLLVPGIGELVGGSQRVS